MTTECIDIALPCRDAVIGLMEYEVAANGCVIVLQPIRKGKLWVGTVERSARLPLARPSHPIAEQAAVLGLRRVPGAADMIYSGTFVDA